MPTYYSQDGEDAVLWALFGSDERGYFAEVGALDGLRLSNCYSFELAGWKGVCVEPHEAYFKLVQQNRPGSTCVHAAVSDHDDDAVEFYANSRGTLSTLERHLESTWKEKYAPYFTGFEVQRVPMRTLTTILDQAGAPTPIDVVSIDVEGHELAVLRGLDFGKYRPRVFVIEALDDDRARQLESFMTDKGYTKARQISSNLFFCRDAADVPVIAAANNDVPRTWTPHPLDHGVQTAQQRDAGRSNRRARRAARAQQAAAPGLLARLKRRLSPASDAQHQQRKAERLRLRAQRRATRQERKTITVDAGFHGDAYLLQLAAHLASRSQAFIETGCNVGSTAAYVARTFAHLQLFSCEADDGSFAIASDRLAPYPQAKVFHEPSPQFLHRLFDEQPQLRRQTNLFWLDAHGYGFRWPLKDEIAFLTKTLDRGYILIDDFRVPDRPDFRFDQSEDQVCAIETIAPDLDPRHAYALVYPAYTQRTSAHHPLTGVGLIVFGDPDFALPPGLQEHFTVTTPTQA